MICSYIFYSFSSKVPTFSHSSNKIRFRMCITFNYDYIERICIINSFIEFFPLGRVGGGHKTVTLYFLITLLPNHKKFELTQPVREEKLL